MVSDSLNGVRQLAKHTGKIRKNLIEKVRRLLGKNFTDGEILDTLGLKPQTLLALKEEILSFDSARFEHLDKDGVYSQYLLNQKQNILDLDRLINSTNPKKAQGSEKSAYVAAIKLRGDIYDKINKLGQELGIVDKVAKEVNVAVKGNVALDLTLSNSNMKKEIEAEKKKLNKIAAGNVIEMREELLGVTDDEVRKFLPASAKVVKPKKRKSKLKKIR